MCNNRQSAASNLSNEQLQVFLTSQLGDGHIHTTNSHSTYYVTNCKYEEYINASAKAESAENILKTLDGEIDKLEKLCYYIKNNSITWRFL